MNATRLLLVPLCAVLVASGCKISSRGGGAHSDVANIERQAEIQRLTAEITSLSNENETLKAQRDAARQELVKLQEQQGSLQNQLGSLLSGGEIAGVYANEAGGVSIGEDFAFAKGSAELNEEGKKSIGQLAERLNKGEFANAKIIIEGHTDDTPVSRSSTVEKYVDNWGLSGARAAAVVRGLEKAGVSSSRLHGAFRGEHEPRTKAADKAANRRVELYLK